MEQPNLRPLGQAPVSGAAEPREPRGTRAANAPESGGPAFQAVLGELLERVQEKTRRITQNSRTLDDARGLSDALGVARESLDDVVNLGDRLLEAYREARQQDTPETEPTPKNTHGNSTQGDEPWK